MRRGNKELAYALICSVYGIGKTTAFKICVDVSLDPYKRLEGALKAGEACEDRERVDRRGGATAGGGDREVCLGKPPAAHVQGAQHTALLPRYVARLRPIARPLWTSSTGAGHTQGDKMSSCKHQADSSRISSMRPELKPHVLHASYWCFHALQGTELTCPRCEPQERGADEEGLAGALPAK